MTSGEAPVRCRRCEIERLQGSIDADEILRQAENSAYIPGVTTPQDEYGKRLEACRECPSLSGGTTCSLCGSLVAFRARIKNSSCPWPGLDRWH